jgi:hypothetical protein
MTKAQLTKLLLKYATVPNQNKTKLFIPAEKAPEIAGEIIKLNGSDFIPPSLDEVKEFFKSKGYNEEGAIKAYDYYTDMEWKDRDDKPVKRWKAKMIANWLRPEFKDVNNNSGTMQSGMVL